MELWGLIKYFELITVVVGTLYYKKYSTTYLKYFLYLMWFVVLVEFSISVLKNNDIIVRNNFIYNVISSLQYIYFFTLYARTIKYKKWVHFFLIIYIVAIAVNFLWFQKLTTTSTFHSFTFSLGAILLIVTIGLFFIEILNSEKVLYFTRYLMFWISIGLFVFYTGVIPLFVTIRFLPTLLRSDSFLTIFFTLNLVMYSCFTIGFILSNKYTNE
jgi:hypothetical protein